jgi:hypothetical protein
MAEATLLELLRELQLCEREARRLHAKGDAWFGWGSTLGGSQFHASAAGLDAKAGRLQERLRALLGPPGVLELPDPEVLARARSEAEERLEGWWSLEAACFFARYPNWGPRATWAAKAFEVWRERP